MAEGTITVQKFAEACIIALRFPAVLLSFWYYNRFSTKKLSGYTFKRESKKGEPKMLFDYIIPGV